jgi:hypothetical protein
MSNWVPEDEALDTAPNLGFLTVVQESAGFYGGYLVTNSWGRPLEFRLSSVVQPNRMQQILYGATLRPYVCADLIGQALLEKSTVPVRLILTDSEAVLELRSAAPMPVAWIAALSDASAEALDKAGAGIKQTDNHRIVSHPNFLNDIPRIREFLRQVDALDLAEPFARIRDALAEARKRGATNRAA